jgi:hypothetical protein
VPALHALYETGGRLGRGGVYANGLTVFHGEQRGDDMIRTLAGWVAEAKCDGVKSLIKYKQIKTYLRKLRKHHSYCQLDFGDR